jgi:class 3 adenylate cyclase/tetratricopeptide (TPR) repeat protein
MTCPRCRTENPPRARFCLECAAPLPSHCVHCGTALPAAAKFCFACAYPVSRPREPDARFGTPAAYTPRHLAEAILASRTALESERKQVTVLFADLKGSMELLADRDPEEARTILDPVLEHMMEAVHRYEGTVNQVMGDGIMALFGAPVAHEDHAVRACYAALRMQERVKGYADEVRRSQAAVVKIRVGLNSGEVVVRAIGSDLRMDYTAVGQTTHLAARMEQIADPGAIVITPDTLALAEGYVEVKSLGPVALKGVVTPMEVYELTGAGPARTRLQVGARRGLTRFIGREAEVLELHRARELALDGRGQVVAIIGEAGVGKSRLFHEFTRSHRFHGWRILETAAVSHGKTTSYLPVVDLLKSYFAIQDRDSVRDIREKVTGKLLALDSAMRPMLPPLLALLGVPVDDAAWAALDPVQRRQRTINAVGGVWLRESQVQPLMVILEDLHWIDAETQDVLESLVESLPAARVLVLVNYRPEYQHGWHGKTYYTQLRLDALAEEGAAELLRALLGGDPALEPLKQRLIARTGGNPFFLEECVRALRETNGLVGDRGAYRLGEGVGTLQVPASVQAVLAARIDRLPPEDKRLLQAAAVVGERVPFPLLEAIADVRDDSLRAGMARLHAADLLHETTLFPDLEYAFTHALTHDVAYSTVLHERRRALHLKVLDALESSAGGQAGARAESLARHALGAEAWRKAATYLREAGRRAASQSAYQAAAGWLEETLRALDRLPQTADVLGESIDARLDLRIALIPLGRYRDALDLMREAEARATRLGDKARLGWILADLCARLRNVLGDHRQAVEMGLRALAIAAKRGDQALELEATYRTGQAHFALGDYGQAIELLSRSSEAAARQHDHGPSFRLFDSWSHAWLAMALSNLGRFVEATEHAAEAVRIAEATDHPFTVVEALTALGGVTLARGDLTSAIGALERAVALGRQWNFQSWATLSRLGYAYALSGRLREAQQVLEETVRSETTLSSMGIGRALQIAWLAETYALDGRLDDASERAQEALSLAQAHGERGHEARVHRLLGEISSHRGDLVEARTADDHYRHALTLATELEMRPLIAHCRLGLGRLYGRAGQREHARQNLATAMTMYGSMNMEPWRAQAEAELRTVA